MKELAKTIIFEDSSGTECSLDLEKLQNSQSDTRYVINEQIGEGGAGEVLSCEDPNLGRDIAMKRLHSNLRYDYEHKARFIREARVMAQLEHPNIVPVHELGVTKDNNVFFTMKKVIGDELRVVLDNLKDDDDEYLENYPTDRMLEIFKDICNAIGFAHSQKIIHRDLKPSNILIGEFGEVLVLDWGLAKIVETDAENNPIMDGKMLTEEGMVSGTPLYMSPEQALGQANLQDEQSDIYSLGAILYEMLTLNYTVEAESVMEILTKVVSGKIIPPRKRTPHRRIPPEIDAIVMKALCREKADRYHRIPDLLEDLDRYSRGDSVSAYREPPHRSAIKWCKRHAVFSGIIASTLFVCIIGATSLFISQHQKSQGLLASAREKIDEGNNLYDRKNRLYEALTILANTNLTKQRSSEELSLESKFTDLHIASENYYQEAVITLSQVDDFYERERFESFGEVYKKQMDFALKSENYILAKEKLSFLKSYLGDNFEKGRQFKEELRLIEKKIVGDGTLKIVTEPAGATIELVKLDENEKGLMSETKSQLLGESPIQERDIKKGSYLIICKYEGRPTVRYPVQIDHLEKELATVKIPLKVPKNMIYIPASKFYYAGKGSKDFRLHERYLNAFYIGKYEVTVKEYMAFWKASDGANFSRDDISRIRLERNSRDFVDAWNEKGISNGNLRPDHPIVGITHMSALRYCSWLSKKRGMKIRLPQVDEWEKAARGVDGRQYVWGDQFVPDSVFTIENHIAREFHGPWAVGGKFPHDKSLYGVMDMAGNVREWTGSRFQGESPFFQIKGASSSTTKRFLLCSSSSDTPVAPSDVGFRIICEIEK
ncbi:MAG: SUMF1/EgtB/PvdO family nonheme iron enzyme [Lentisphaeria bacterium]|nr:bifunctional serine/threonine-protein kinase/formylglycine-generating enzyme family protein [Lentisphaeria bacterium]NQZ69244.1 SUMF1/EgtB/PvdO family nonheme iron enzyme [Lentisphaeria bacterium]